MGSSDHLRYIFLVVILVSIRLIQIQFETTCCSVKDRNIFVQSLHAFLKRNTLLYEQYLRFGMFFRDFLLAQNQKSKCACHVNIYGS